MLTMKLQIHSWNVRGLEMSDRKYIARRWCNSIKGKDIVCLQEIKANGYEAFNTLKFIWGNAKCFYSNHDKGKGGIATLINPNLEKMISVNGVSPCNRALWVIIECDEAEIGICNIYAPNDYRERSKLWEWLANNLPKVKWIFAGDFNMIECPKDKVGGGKFEWKNNEMFFWNRFKRTFGINDPMAGLKGGHEGIWYTWCNNQANKARIYCRLDRIYINKHEMSTI